MDSHNKYILGFQINGIGNGHLTQAKTIYDVLIKKYKIPVVIIYGKNNYYDDYFFKSKVFYHKYFSSQESTNNMNIIPHLKDIFMIKPTKKYEEKFEINKWFNFFVCDYFNYRTKQIIIANQFSFKSIQIDFLTNLTKLLSNVSFVSIHMSNKYTKHTIPPLINMEYIKRNIKKNVILAYSVSGQDFPTRLIKIAKRYSNYKFYYFTKTIINKKKLKNITIFEPDKKNFKIFISMCEAILCTAGDTFPCECVYNKIPFAIMPCSSEHFEQVNNTKKYIDTLKYATYMSDNLDLDFLVKKDMTKYCLDLKKILHNRDEKILNLVNIN